MTLLVHSDRVWEFGSNVGSNPVVMLGSPPSYRTWTAGGLDGLTVEYTIEHDTSGQWECGIGVYTASTKTLTRVTIVSNSDGTHSPVVFAPGTVDVWNDLSAEKMVNLDADSSHLTLPGGLSLAGALDGITTLSTSSTGTFGGALTVNATGSVFSAGTDASTDLGIGNGGSSPSTGRTVSLTLAVPDSGSFRGAAKTVYKRAAGIIWSTGVYSSVSGAMVANTDFVWDPGTGTPVAALSSTGSLVLSGTLGVVGAVTLTVPLSTANGGTGLASYTAGDLTYYSGGTVLTKLGIGSTGDVLRVSGGVPTWSTESFPNTATTGDMLYASATNVWSNLAIGANANVILTQSGGVPAWSAQPTLSGGTDSDTTVTFGTGGVSPSAIRQAALVLNAPDSGSFRGRPIVVFQRASVEVWDIRVPAAITGTDATVTDLSFRPNGNAVMSLTTAGQLTLAAGLVATTGVFSSTVSFTGGTFTTTVSSVTAQATPGPYVATTGTVFASTVSGATLMGFGTTYDVALKNRAGVSVLGVVANATNVNIPGVLGPVGPNANNQIALNASGANFGFIGNANSSTWFLGYGGTLGTIGTSVLTWNSSNAVNMAGALAITGALSGVTTMVASGDVSAISFTVTGSGGVTGRGLSADGTANGVIWNVLTGGTGYFEVNSAETGRFTSTGFQLASGKTFVMQTDPGQVNGELFRVGTGGVFSSGTDASTDLYLGQGGSAPSAGRSVYVALNLPDSVSNRGKGGVMFGRASSYSWTVGLSPAIAGALLGINDIGWTAGGDFLTPSMAFTTGGSLRIGFGNDSSKPWLNVGMNPASAGWALFQRLSTDSVELTVQPTLVKTTSWYFTSDRTATGGDNIRALLGIMQFGIGQAASQSGAGLVFVGSRSSHAQFNAATFTAVQNGDVLGQIFFTGDNGVTVRTQGAYIQAQATETWSNVTNATDLFIATTATTQTSASNRWVFKGRGDLIAFADNVYDFGASGGSRARTGYFGTSLVVGTDPGQINSEILRVGGTAVWRLDQNAAMIWTFKNADNTNTSSRTQINMVAGTTPQDLRLMVQATGGAFFGTTTGSTSLSIQTANATAILIDTTQHVILGTDPGGTDILRVGGGVTLSGGTDANSIVTIGTGGASPTGIRTVRVMLNTPDTGANRGNAYWYLGRASTDKWYVGIRAAVTGVSSTIDDYSWDVTGSTQVASLTAGGQFRTTLGYVTKGGAAGSFGTADNFALNFLVNNATAASIATNGVFDVPGSVTIGTATSRANAPGLNVRTVSSAAQPVALSLQQINTGTSAGVAIGFTGADSASTLVDSGYIWIQKSAAWTNGGAASTFMSKMVFQVLDTNVITTYLTLDANAGQLTFGATTSTNYSFGGAGSFGSGKGSLFISNGNTDPTSNPTGGGLLFSSGGAGKWRGSSGTVTTFGPAEPHCPECHSDFGVEYESAKYGYLAVCLNCLTRDFGDKPYIRRRKVAA